MATQVMVELHNGYGDGFGVVAVDSAGVPIVNPGHAVKSYAGGEPMEQWRRAILSAPYIAVDGVRVPSSAIKRIVGPLECPEAIRIRAGRYTKNWRDRAFVSIASDEQLAMAMAGPHESEIYDRMCNLRRICG